MSIRIGIIAEEQNDVDVIVQFTRKILPGKRFSTSQFVGHGCGKIRSKCSAWARILRRKGCHYLIVLHDLDKFDGHVLGKSKETQLRSSLEEKISATTFDKSIVVIPIEEIEAWLLCDGNALKQVFSMSKVPSVPTFPEKVPDPKGFMKKLVWKCCKKRYVHTVHNSKIAEEISIKKLSVCSSFSSYPKFLLPKKKKT